MQQLCPAASFGRVEKGIYRHGSIHPINFSFLHALQLKTVVRLSPEAPARVVLTFFKESNIKFIHLGLKAYRAESSWRRVTDDLIKEALEIVLDVTTHPVCINCTSGEQETGVLVGCLRRLQGWNLTSTLHEYRRFTKHRRLFNEQFIELFDVDLVTLPGALPDWWARRSLEGLAQRELEEKAAAGGALPQETDAEIEPGRDACLERVPTQ
eukprot:TRINITY_DN26328_c0_g1_i1.p1 TRINITY_DN26328_c0_g1~~TRINITY_DN26328_c0_g1_i1.p1  ORF type:complete len:211 (-),score=69.56 TRINITY_DN26328_c0_g1_i1:194-826(-)